MELKDYQKHCINEVKVYLEHLVEFRAKYEKILAIVPDMSGDFTRKAWEKAKGGITFQGAIHYDKKNGLGEPLPNFCIKTDGSLLPVAIAKRCFGMMYCQDDRPSANWLHHVCF